MEIIKPGTLIDFMKYRKPVLTVSIVLVVLSIISVFFPGPNYGIDFAGGTEIQVVFGGEVSTGEIRTALEGLGYKRPDVVKVLEGSPYEFMIRVQEFSTLNEEQKKNIEKGIQTLVNESEIQSFKFSPGGDKITLRTNAEINIDSIKETVTSAGTSVRSADVFASGAEKRYEIQLVGLADELVEQLKGEFKDKGPKDLLRVEWVGPKAGKLLRDAAIEAMLYAIVFIMIYVAFRFDLRFAPGGVLAMFHDAVITIGIYVLVQKEISLTTVAALLTIVGYSINDTIVVYDRIRENMGKFPKKPLREIINMSTSQMLSRTVVTSGTTLLSVIAFFIWGTPVIRDISFALFIGILIGTYSSIYVAAPVTEWMDRRFFQKG